MAFDIYINGGFFIIEVAGEQVIHNPRSETSYAKPTTDQFQFEYKEPIRSGQQRQTSYILGNGLTFLFSELTAVYEDNVLITKPVDSRALGLYLDYKIGIELTQNIDPVIPVNPATTYFKDEVVVVTNSNNFNSNTPSDAPGLTYTIPAGKDGDYVFYTIVNCNNDQNEDLECYFALNGTTVIESEARVTQRKNQDDSVQNTFPFDGLVAGDTVTVQLNTNNDNVDLETRRILIQSWSLV